MLAASAVRTDPDDPLSGLEVGERPDPEPSDGWTTVRLRAASLNHHDLWSLQGVGLPADRLPMVLGCDGAGVDEDGNEVVVHAVISDPDHRGDETLDPRRSLLSERYDGTLADLVAVPRRNLVPKPTQLTFEEAACLPTAWLTAYRMLFTQAGAQPGQTVLVQGAGGGVADRAGRDRARGRAADVGDQPGRRRSASARSSSAPTQAFESGARLPERVDAVMETVGEPTWDHSLKSLAQGGTLVVSGATGGHAAVTDLRRVFFLQQRIVGSTMGTRDELARLVRLMAETGLRPVVDSVAAAGGGRVGVPQARRRRRVRQDRAHPAGLIAAMTHDTSRSLPRWLDLAWRTQVDGWIADRLADAGLRRTDEAEQQRAYPWSTVIRIGTDAGPVWFKANSRGMHHEAALYAVLLRRCPGHVLDPVALDVAQGWLLLPDGGRTLRDVEGARADLAVWERMLVEYAQMQRALEPYVDELLVAGVPAAGPSSCRRSATRCSRHRSC